jgi:hypothetical protein
LLGIPGNILPLALADFSRAPTTNRGVLVREHVECWADYIPSSAASFRSFTFTAPCPISSWTNCDNLDASFNLLSSHGSEKLSSLAALLRPLTSHGSTAGKKFAKEDVFCIFLVRRSIPASGPMWTLFGRWFAS